MLFEANLTLGMIARQIKQQLSSSVPVIPEGNLIVIPNEENLGLDQAIGQILNLLAIESSREERLKGIL